MGDTSKRYRRGTHDGDGHHYVVSPYATVFDDGHYYLVVYDKRYNKMVNYRIDRMDKVEIIEDVADTPPEELQFILKKVVAVAATFYFLLKYTECIDKLMQVNYNS